MKSIISKALKSFGYEIKKTKGNRIDNNYFTLYQYTDKNGDFDYQKYKEVQVAGNKRKIESVWVQEENIKFLADYISKTKRNADFGICHGTRRGKEQEWFMKYLNNKVIGTEISDNAKDFPHTIQWDFHEVKEEWINNVDFIYSNSLDHSYDPEKCLNAWMSCLKPGGICIIEHSSVDTPDFTSDLDPFGAHLGFMPYIILTWAKGKYGVRELISTPVKKEFATYSSFIILEKY